MYRIGFSHEKYIALQSEKIAQRIGQFGNKLYLEFGGKLFDDFHASRVLPGFAPNSKVQMLSKLSGIAEIVLVVKASDIEKNKVTGDYGITYDEEILRQTDAFRSEGFLVNSVVISQFAGQDAAVRFKRKLELLGVTVYLHYPIADYPTNIPLITGENGFGQNDFIETERPLIVVAGPGASSGKMAACLSQLYHEFKRGVSAGYAKFETFPVWDLAPRHPINLAYEAATTNVGDINLIDPFHLEAYGVTATSYNRDVEGFLVLDAIFKQIWGVSPYKSPTDMGVNLISECICDEDVCIEAARQEIIRRYYNALCADRNDGGLRQEIQKLELLMNATGAEASQRAVTLAALNKAEQSGTDCVALELPCGTTITGKTTPLLGASAAALLNALKYLANIGDDVKLISPIMIEPIQRLKLHFLGNVNPRLHTDEVLIALSICTATNPTAEKVLEQLPLLKNSEAHSTVILSQVDFNVFKRLGVNITCEPVFHNDRLFRK
ncbi:MAG: DUF1846 domain-containing protein [Defluviitaleaceae bacterium]|nr:DUF1846 domain-containing protein [Defluviitaleaceae bacterium]